MNLCVSVTSAASQHQFSLQLHSLTDGSDRTNFVRAFEVFSVLALCLKNVAAVVSYTWDSDYYFV